MDNLIPLPTALKARDDRVQAICSAVAHGKAVRPLTDAWEADGQVCLEVGEIEVWLDPDEAAELAGKLACAASAARGRAGR